MTASTSLSAFDHMDRRLGNSNVTVDEVSALEHVAFLRQVRQSPSFGAAAFYFKCNSLRYLIQSSDHH